MPGRRASAEKIDSDAPIQIPVSIQKDGSVIQKIGSGKKPRKTSVAWDKVKQEEALRLIAHEGYGKMAAAAKVGVSYDCFRDHVLADPEFARLLSLAEIQGTGRKVENVEGALYGTAMAGNVTAQQVFLYNKAGDVWKDRRNLQVTGEITVEASARILALTLGLPVDRILPSAPEPGLLPASTASGQGEMVDEPVDMEGE